MANLAGLKAYYVACGDESDAQLDLCLDAAKAWFRRAGVPEMSDPLYDLGVYRLAVFYLESRNPATEASMDALPYGIQGIVLQLQDCGVT